ncbi:MAG: FIST signal transduction protein [Nannocystales bacterium]
MTMTATGSDVSTVVKELRAQMGELAPTTVLYFASSRYDLGSLSAAMQAAFDGAKVFGCTTAGEIGGGRMLEGSVVAMALDGETVPNVAVEVIEDVANRDDVPNALERLGEKLGTAVASLDVSRYVGVILIDGLSTAEERVLDSLGNLSDIAVVGASAGDDMLLERTHVFADGQAHAAAAVLAILEVPAGFEVIKTQSFRTLDKTLVATKVDEPQRTVIEFNGKPAMEAYAEALNTDVETAATLFMRHPMGLMDGEEPYVRSPQQQLGGSMMFFCQIKEGMNLALLESTDIVADTREVLASRATANETVGLVNFHCILRTLELKERGDCPAYGELFTDLPAIGFSTYGEAFIGHVNQTSTMLVLRR